MDNQEKIKQLKYELETLENKKKVNTKEMEEIQEIKRLQKEIKAKKHSELARVTHNIKVIGKNIGMIGSSVGKGMEKFIGESPAKKGKTKTIDEIMKDLPQ